MAFSLNKIMLIGNLGKDSETRFTASSKSVTNFSLATTHSYKGKDGNWVEESVWHNIVAWEQSDFMKEALVKGAKFYVEGRLTKRDYTDKSGVKKYITEVVAEKLIPLNNQLNHQEQAMVTTGENTNDPSSDEPDEDLPF